MTEAGYWVHDLDPKLFYVWGDLGVSYYGLAYVLSFFFGVAIHRLLLKKGLSPFTREQEEAALYAFVMGVLIGARVGYVILYALPEFFERPIFLIEVWNGGMSFHGGLLGVVVACWYISRRTGVSMLQTSDLVSPMFPIGLLLGRIANFINGELWGRITDVSWAVVFPRSAPGSPVDLIPPRHPSQLYEAALEGAVLLAWLQWRFWKSDAAQRPGKLTGEFMMLYAAFRIFCEYFREPDASLILGVSRGMFYSLFVFLGGMIFWILAARRDETPCPAAGNTSQEKVPRKKRKPRR